MQKMLRDSAIFFASVFLCGEKIRKFCRKVTDANIESGRRTANVQATRKMKTWELARLLDCAPTPASTGLRPE